MVKNPPANTGDRQKPWVPSLGREDSPEDETVAHSSILAWEIHGQRSLAGYGPWGREESATERHLTAMCFCNMLVRMRAIFMRTY